MSLILRELTLADEDAFLAGLETWKGEDPTWYSFDWKGDYAAMLERLRKNRLGLELDPKHVPSSMLYAFVDGEIVGRLSIRHTLNENLRKRGGHIGYAVAPKFRQRGYASEIMKQGLTFCQELGISDVMLTCADANVGSWKVIEKFGGVLQETSFDDDAKEMKRIYWIR